MSRSTERVEMLHLSPNCSLSSTGGRGAIFSFMVAPSRMDTNGVNMGSFPLTLSNERVAGQKVFAALIGDEGREVLPVARTPHFDDEFVPTSRQCGIKLHDSVKHTGVLAPVAHEVFSDQRLIVRHGAVTLVSNPRRK